MRQISEIQQMLKEIQFESDEADREAMYSVVDELRKLEHPRKFLPRIFQWLEEICDSPEGRRQYSPSMATVEPVFGNLRYNKGLDRYTLRIQIKVNTQWNLFCLVHNIEKLAHCGHGARR